MKICLKNVKIISSLILVFAISFFSSCSGEEMGRKDKVAAIIGTLQDPFLAATFTPEVLIKKSGVTDGTLPFAAQTIATFMMSESKTGIANSEQVQVVVENSGGMIPNVLAFIPLKNAEKFKILVKNELGAEIQEKNGASYFRKDADNYVVAWKDDLAIITNIPLSLDNLFSKGTNQSKKIAIRLVKLLNEVSEKTIDTKFRTFFDKKGDMQLYANGTSAYELIDGIRFMSKKEKARYKSMLMGTKIESALNFENGSILLNSTYDFADSLKIYMDVLAEGGISEGMLAYGLKKKPMMAISANLNTKNIVGLLKSQASFLEINELERDLNKVNLSTKDLDKLYNGQVLVMLDGFDTIVSSFENYKGELENYKNYKPRVGIVIGIKDMPKVEQLMTSGKLKADSEGKDNDMYFHVADNKLFLTGSKEWLSAIKEGRTTSITNQNLTESPIGVFLNPKITKQADFDFEGLKMINNKVLDLIGKLNAEGLEMSIKMKDDSKNALRVILESMVEEFENQDKSMNSDIESLLNDEMMEKIGSEVESGIEEIINSDEMKDLKKAFEALESL